MKMDSNLGRGFYEVYNSSKEILKNNQKHLYHSMLDLLASTSKSTPAAVVGKILRSDEFVRFWIEDILPLAFDEDATIQGSAINALEQGLLALDISNIPNGSCWNGVKNKIVKEYAPRVHQLREDRSQYWHRVWCILIRLLDREILKSASTINLFLSIVELGFRSPDNSVRAEAFTCWRLLIQIFANHNQLTSPKRLKLVCIPLKSSQSKTPYVAAVKLRIWWYLITCLGPQINENFENVVETFLIFCFGSESKGTPGIIQQYLSVRELALTCLATIVSKEQDDFLQRLLREYEMEPLAQNTQIVNSNTIENFGKSIFYAVFEASNLLIENGKQSDLELRLLNVIIKNSTRILINNDIASLFEYFCEGLRQITEKSCIPIKIVADVIGTEGLRFSHSLSDFDNYIKILHYLVQFLTSGREFISHNIIQQCISQISNLDAFISKNMCWRAVEVIADYLVNMLNDEDFVYFEIKFLIWRHISSEMVNTIRNKTFGRTADEFIDILISWSLWPLRMVTEFTGRRNTTIFDEHFYLLWHNLLQLSENTVGRMQLLTEVAEVLSTMLRSDYEWGVFVNLFNAYADEVMKHDCANYSKHYEQLFLILQEVIQKKLPSKEKEKLLTIFRCVLHGLKTPDSSLLESIKCSLKHVIRNSSKGGVNSKFYEEWKHSILNIVRAFIDKNFTNQVTELFKDDVYVIIPSVWSLKPEKLTDRQKERIAEKTSIPALYNDMSQSQDSLIKPWTPKKIVIAKEDQNEIIIEGLNMRRNQNISTVRDEFQNKTSLDISSSHKNIGAVPSTSKENLETLLNNSIDKSNMEMDHNKPQEVNAKKCNSKEANEIDDEDLTPIINSKVSQAVNNESYPRCITEDSIRAAPNDFRDNHLMNCVESNETESVNTASVSESVKEASPKKSSTKNSLLLSPPDRKLTNNNSSPKLRPKPPAHLTGRGAQLINMIRNRKMDAQSPQTPMPRLFVAKTDSIDRTVPDMDITVVEHTSTPLASKDILTFSKRLPSPSASPSTSILKRNRRESLEDISFDSPACKKKRVSFHDPPVSLTKEYIKYNDENKSKPKRCLIMDKMHSSIEKGSENKYLLKRRSKLDSIIEIEKFSIQQPNKLQEQLMNQSVRAEDIDDDNICCLDTEENESSNKIGSSKLTQNSLNLSEKKNETGLPSNALELVIEKYTLDELLEKYLDCGKDTKLKHYNTIAKTMSKGMSDNSKIKEGILEALSENHSKDFLDHAIRENLASVVCDRLNLPSVIEYVCEKSKINTACRANLFAQIPDILKHCKQDAERLKVLQTMFGSSSLKDSDILDLIQTLLRMRSMDKTMSVTVSEAAIDSSSNL